MCKNIYESFKYFYTNAHTHTNTHACSESNERTYAFILYMHVLIYLPITLYVCTYVCAY